MTDSLFLKIHHFLIPQSRNMGYMPYIWLVYLNIYFVHLYFWPPYKLEWLIPIIGTTGFLFFYFRALWMDKREVIYYIFGIWAIGALLSLLNSGASVFFVYATCYCCMVGKPKLAAALIFLLCGLTAVQVWLLDFPPEYYLPAIFFGAILGLINIYYFEVEQKNRVIRLSQDEISQLSATAERERIARDLHDVVGHSLSVIALKSELANKLAEKDSEQSRNEIREVEVLARDVLKQVRQAVSGYRESDIKTELNHAKVALDAARIRFDCEIGAFNLPTKIDQVLSIILRESITNVVRHSDASRCEVKISTDKKYASMVISDNGNIRKIREGNGIRGMRERVLESQGNFSIEVNDGLQLSVSVPLTKTCAKQQS